MTDSNSSPTVTAWHVANERVLTVLADAAWAKKRKFKDYLNDVLEAAIKDGSARTVAPQPKTGSGTFRGDDQDLDLAMPMTLHERINDLARARGISDDELVRGIFASVEVPLSLYVPVEVRKAVTEAAVQAIRAKSPDDVSPVTLGSVVKGLIESRPPRQPFTGPIEPAQNLAVQELSFSLPAGTVAQLDPSIEKAKAELYQVVYERFQPERIQQRARA